MIAKLKTDRNQLNSVIKKPWILENKISGSKYLANRLLVIAALSQKACVIDNLPENNDIRTLYKALVDLGYALSWEVDGSLVSQGLSERKLPKAQVKIECGASGTMARFIVAVAALDNFPITIDGSERLRQRPMAPLFTALEDLGVCIETENSFLPATITGPVKGNSVSLPGDLSSQYASALLLIGAQLEQGLNLQLIEPVVSAQYIKMTCQLLEKAGVVVEQQGFYYQVAKNPVLLGGMALNADPCSASYALAASVLSGRSLTIKPFDYLPKQQGEFGIIDCLKKMGCQVELGEHWVKLTPPETRLRSFTYNMSDMPDIVQTLAVLACFAEGTTRFEGISHLRYKESDRIVDTANELQKLGATARYGDDWLEVDGAHALQGTELKSHDDHRMAMALAQFAWKIDDVQIEDPDVVAKSFPKFWQLMETMGMEVNYDQVN